MTWSTDTFEEKTDSNQGPSVYQLNALPLGQIGSQKSERLSRFYKPKFKPSPFLFSALKLQAFRENK